MATFAYDTTGAPPLEMDFPLIDDTYATGEFLACGTTDGTDLGALKSAAGIYASVVGILCDAAQTTTGTHAGKNIDEGRVIYNPMGVYRTQHIFDGTSDISVTAYTSGTPDLNFTCGSGLGYPNAGGGFIYVTKDAAAGTLAVIDSSSVATTTQTIVLITATATDITTDSDIIIIPPPFSDGYAVQLTDVGIDGSDIDAPATPGTTGLAVGLMDNWIERTRGVMERLRPSRHEGLINLDTNGVKFYTDICLAPSHFLL